MTSTLTPTARTTDDMRDVLAFALTVCDREHVAPYNVEAASRGGIIRIYLDTENNTGVEDGRRLFTALGGHRHKERRYGKTWSIASSEWSEWAKQEFGGANVAFGGRLIEVQIVCSMTEDVGDTPAAT